jgi:hypothetical protein
MRVNSPNLDCAIPQPCHRTRVAFARRAKNVPLLFSSPSNLCPGDSSIIPLVGCRRRCLIHRLPDSSLTAGHLKYQPIMARPEYLSVRLIVWEGVLRDPRAQVKAYTNQLKDNIAESLQDTQWKYSRWKTYPAESTGKQKLEVRSIHYIAAPARNSRTYDFLSFCLSGLHSPCRDP